MHTSNGRHQCGDLEGLNALPALHCLTRDEAEFIDATFARILAGEGSRAGGARHVDRRLWESSQPASPSLRHRQEEWASGTGRQPAATDYRAAIEAVQTHCIRVHDRRFQDLTTREQDGALVLLEDGGEDGGIGRFETTLWMMVSDAAEAHFEAMNIAAPPARREALAVP